MLCDMRGCPSISNTYWRSDSSAESVAYAIVQVPRPRPSELDNAVAFIIAAKDNDLLENFVNYPIGRTVWKLASAAIARSEKDGQADECLAMCTQMLEVVASPPSLRSVSSWNTASDSKRFDSICQEVMQRLCESFVNWSPRRLEEQLPHVKDIIVRVVSLPVHMSYVAMVDIVESLFDMIGKVALAFENHPHDLGESYRAHLGTLLSELEHQHLALVENQKVLIKCFDDLIACHEKSISPHIVEVSPGYACCHGELMQLGATCKIRAAAWEHALEGPHSIDMCIT
jgi:hypothetical protein